MSNEKGFWAVLYIGLNGLTTFAKAWVWLFGAIPTAIACLLGYWCFANWNLVAEVSLNKYWSLVRREYIMEENDRMQEAILQDLTEREGEVKQREADLTKKLAKAR